MAPVENYDCSCHCQVPRRLDQVVLSPSSLRIKNKNVKRQHLSWLMEFYILATSTDMILDINQDIDQGIKLQQPSNVLPYQDAYQFVTGFVCLLWFYVLAMS